MMVKNNVNQPTKTILILAIMLSIVTPHVLAAETLGQTIDCSTVVINYTENPEWSRQERIKAMDKAFFESIHRFELCNLSNQSNALSATANSMEAESDPDSGDGTEASSNKSTTMKGTETGAEKEADADTDPTTNNSSQTEKTNSQPTKKPRASSTSNGASPEDIPSANNDDVIAAQIRVAAEIEQDPVKKNKLWNEYRKYKGLPTQ